MNNAKTNTMNTEMIKNLKSAITTQDELNALAAHLWQYNFENLLRKKFGVEYATTKASELAQRQIELLLK